MEKLSSDILHTVFQELDATTLCRLAQVSKDFQVVADSNSVWNIAHGFTKERSLEIVRGHIRELLDIEQELEDITYYPYVEHPEVNTDWDAAEEDRVWCEHSAKLAAVSLAMLYRTLRVPFRLREALSVNLLEWFRITDHLRPTWPKLETAWPVWRPDFVKPPGWDETATARRTAEYAITEWEKATGHDVLSEPYSIAYSYGIGHCCLHSAWSKQWIPKRTISHAVNL
jgi:hypothetical protein